MSWLPPAEGSTLLVLDLPNGEPAARCVELAKRGFRPVPLYNAIPWHERFDSISRSKTRAGGGCFGYHPRLESSDPAAGNGEPERCGASRIPAGCESARCNTTRWAGQLRQSLRIVSNRFSVRELSSRPRHSPRRACATFSFPAAERSRTHAPRLAGRGHRPRTKTPGSAWTRSTYSSAPPFVVRPLLLPRVGDGRFSAQRSRRLRRRSARSFVGLTCDFLIHQEGVRLCTIFRAARTGHATIHDESDTHGRMFLPLLGERIP